MKPKIINDMSKIENDGCYQHIWARHSNSENAWAIFKLVAITAIIFVLTVILIIGARIE